jgi:uncharacterized membrane protein
MNENKSFDDRLMEAARTLQTEVAPDRDLWPEIEGAIGRKPPARGWNTIFAQAAVVVLLVGASSGLTYLAISKQTPYATPPAPGGLIVERANFGDKYMLGPDYQDARNSLKSQLDAQLERLSSEERADIMKNLEAIRAVIEEINRALSNDPDNTLLQELLLSSYQDELSLMMKVDGIANAAMYRTDF